VGGWGPGGGFLGRGGAVGEDTRLLPRLVSRSFSLGRAGLRVQVGDRHTRDYGAACRGPTSLDCRGSVGDALTTCSMFLAGAWCSRRAPGSGDGARGLWAETRRPLGLGAPLVPRHTLAWVEPAPERGWGGLARRGIESRADCTHPIGGLAEVGRAPCRSGARGPQTPPRPLRGNVRGVFPDLRSKTP
jgi:hypothetical protein